MVLKIVFSSLCDCLWVQCSITRHCINVRLCTTDRDN